MLFATLDPTMRRLAPAAMGPEVILSDTVGFISDLPTELVAAFRATLEEVLAADLILHVRDISHVETEEQATDVRAILEALGVGAETPLLEIWNKTDQLGPAELEDRLAAADIRPDCLAVSAVTGAGVEALTAEIATRLTAPTTTTEITLPFEAGRARAWLYEQGVVDDEQQRDNALVLTVTWTSRQERDFLYFGV